MERRLADPDPGTRPARVFRYTEATADRDSDGYLRIKPASAGDGGQAAYWSMPFRGVGVGV